MSLYVSVQVSNVGSGGACILCILEEGQVAAVLGSDMAFNWIKSLIRFCSAKMKGRELSRFPPSVNAILQRKETISKNAVPHHTRDDILTTIFRIYVALVAGQQLWMRTEVERFWNRHRWRVSEIPDPCDSDPVRYAVLATIPYLLVRAFNRNIGLGLPRDAPPIWTEEQEMEFRARPKQFESVPEWAEKVPALDTRLLLPDALGDLPSSESDSTADPDMLRKNILTKWQPVYFI